MFVTIQRTTIFIRALKSHHFCLALPFMIGGLLCNMFKIQILNISHNFVIAWKYQKNFPCFFYNPVIENLKGFLFVRNEFNIKCSDQFGTTCFVKIKALMRRHFRVKIQNSLMRIYVKLQCFIVNTARLSYQEHSIVL